MADRHCSFTLLKALCNPSSLFPLPTTETGKPNTHFQCPFKLATTMRPSLAQGTKKTCCRKGLCIEKRFCFPDKLYVCGCFFLPFFPFMLLSALNMNVMTGSAAAILLPWDKTVWQGIADWGSLTSVSHCWALGYLFTFSLFVVWEK